MLKLYLQSTPKEQPHVTLGAQQTEQGREQKCIKGSKPNAQLKRLHILRTHLEKQQPNSKMCLRKQL